MRRAPIICLSSAATTLWDPNISTSSISLSRGGRGRRVGEERGEGEERERREGEEGRDR